jgi:hypothetical protein
MTVTFYVNSKYISNTCGNDDFARLRAIPIDLDMFRIVFTVNVKSYSYFREFEVNMVNAVCPHNFGYKKICLVVRVRPCLKKEIEFNENFTEYSNLH